MSEKEDHKEWTKRAVSEFRRMMNSLPHVECTAEQTAEYNKMLEELNNPPCRYIGLPWRKPEESPDHRSECLIVDSEGSVWVAFYIKAYDYFEIQEFFPRRETIQAWCYVKELPLPDWVQK